MNDSAKQQLTDAGVNLPDAMERFMNNEALLERFLKRFLDDQNFQKLTDAVASGSWDSALAASHTLKGTCGNLSFTRLYELFSRQCGLIREAQYSQAAAMMEEITAAYAQVTGAIRGCL